MWRYRRLFFHSFGECTERSKDQGENTKAKDGASISQRAAQIVNGVSTEDEQNKICPRCDRELHAFRTASGQLMSCRGWDLAGKPCTLIKMCGNRAVNFKGRGIPNVPEMDVWRLVLVVHTLVKGRTRCQDKTVAASHGVKPSVGARTFRAVAASSSTLPASSVSAAAGSVIQLGAVADAPTLRRGRRVHWESVEHGYANGSDWSVTLGRKRLFIVGPFSNFNRTSF